MSELFRAILYRQKDPVHYPDNKHAIIQVSVFALKKATVFVSFELLHGLYYEVFQLMTEDHGHLSLYQPERAMSMTLQNEVDSNYQFLAVLTQEATLEVTMPLNLPAAKEIANVDGSSLLIDRVADYHVGDPSYLDAHSSAQSSDILHQE